MKRRIEAEITRATMEKIESGKRAVVLEVMTRGGEISSYWGWLTDKAGPWTGKTLKRLGWDGKSLSSIGALVGEKVVCVLAKAPADDFFKVEWIGKPRPAILIEEDSDVLELLNTEEREGESW